MLKLNLKTHLKKNGDFFFLIQNVLGPLGYLAGIMVWLLHHYFYKVSRYLNTANHVKVVICNKYKTTE